MSNHLSLADKIVASLDVGAQIASAGVNGAVLDMQGWSGCLYLINLGTMVAGATYDARVMGSANANFSGNANITNASITQVANTSNTNLVMLDVYRPSNRYIKLVTTPATANSTVGVVAVRYGRTGNLPPTQSAAEIVRVQAN